EGRLERLLQQLRVDLVVQLGAHAEHLRVHIAARGEEDVRGVVQPHPAPTVPGRPPAPRAGPCRHHEAACPLGPSSRNASISSYASFSGRAKRGSVMKPCTACSMRCTLTRLPASASACA